jgi:hypothetical protein
LSECAYHTYIKYAILSIFFITAGFFFLLFGLKIKPKNLFKTHYLLESGRKILSRIFKPIPAKIFSFLIKKFHNSNIIILVLFFLITLIRWVYATSFMISIIFNFDLRYCIYLTPFLFVAWLLSFCDYYISYYVTKNIEYIHKIANFKVKQNKISDNGIIINRLDISVFLTPFGISKRFSDPEYVGSKLLILAGFKIKYDMYKTKTNLPNKIAFIIRLVSWILITIYFLTHVT